MYIWYIYKLHKYARTTTHEYGELRSQSPYPSGHPWPSFQSWNAPSVSAERLQSPLCFLCELFQGLELPSKSRGIFLYTLPETNIAPENRHLKKEIPIGNHHFRVLC